MGRTAWVVAGLVACSPGCVGTPAEDAPVAASAARLSSPLELGALRPMEGFRAAGSGWRCASAALRVRGDADGTVTVVPGAQAHGITFGTVSAVAPRVTVDADGSLAMERGGVVERWRSGADAVEQSWAFDRAPAGDVTVRVHVTGARYDGPSGDGLRFVDASGAALRYGAATWVDARGVRTPVGERVEGDGVVITVPADLVARSAFPAVLDPTISAEVAVDPVELSTQTRTVMGRASIASGSTGQFAVWQDSRTPPGVYGARISAAGAVLDPANLLLVRGMASPVVTSDGPGYLVAWIGDVNELYWSRVDASGAMLDPGGVARAGSLRGSAMALAFDGTNYVLAWSAVSGSSEIRVARIGRSGALLDPGGVVVSTGGTAERRNPALAANAGGALVAWEDLRDGLPRIYAARVTPAGVVSDPNGRVVSLAAANQTQPSVATDGTSFLVGWWALMGSGSRAPGPYAALVGPSGATASIEALWPTPGADTGSGPLAVAFSGGRYLAAWSSFTMSGSSRLPRVSAVRLDAAGALLDATPRVAARIDAVTPPFAPAFTSIVATGRPGGFRLLWAFYDGLASYLQSVATDLEAAPAVAPATVESAPVDQTFPQLVANAGGYLVGWTDMAPILPQSWYHARGVRLSPAGALLDATPISLADQEYFGSSMSDFTLRIAAFGTAYLAGWSRAVSPALLMRPVSAAGVTGAVASTSESNRLTALAAARTNALGLFGSVARRFGPDGRALDAFPISLPGIREASVVSDGTNYLLPGSYTPPGCTVPTTCPRVGVLRLNGAGDLLDATPIPIAASIQRAGFSSGNYEASAAFDGTRYLVVWRGSGLGGNNVELAAARVGTDGVALDATPIVVSSAVSAKRSLSVAYDGTSWVVAWGDSRDGNSAYAARVSAAGAVLDPVGVAVATGLAELPAVRVASTGDGRSAVVYSRRATVATPVSARLLVRMLSFGDGGVIDAGTVDAGATDAGVVVADVGATDAGVVVTDAGATDTGAVATDAGVSDTGVVATDAGVADVETTDAGVIVADVGTSDGGSTDAGTAADVTTTDTGVRADAGVVTTDTGAAVDVGVTADAGAADVVDADVPSTPPPPEDGGLCDVGGAPGAHGARTGWAVAALGLVGLTRRRRDRRGRSR